MKANQRVVKSIPDQSGRVYTKTQSGGRARMQAAARYMDERGHTQLYALREGQLHETDRDEACERIEETETKYQQHLVMTTTLESAHTYIDERNLANQVSQALQTRRVDAEIYAVAVHSDGKGEEKLVHVHVIVGTDTTLRRDDLMHMRESAFKIEQDLQAEQQWEWTADEQVWIRQMQTQHQLTRTLNEKTQEEER